MAGAAEAPVAAETGSSRGSQRSSQPSEADSPALRLRLLCPHSLVPLLIGKKGENVKRIRRESGALVSVADPVLGCDERVVHIAGESLDNEASTAAADALCGVFDSICCLRQRKAESLAAAAAATPLPSPPVLSPPAGSEAGSLAEGEGDGSGENAAAAANGSATGTAAANGSGDAAAVADTAAAAAVTKEDTASPMALSSAAGGSSSASAVGGSSGPASVAGSNATAKAGAAAAAAAAAATEARLLVDSQLVGYLVGRGGATIKDTIARSGASVRVLPKAELPACACIGDEVVKVGGGQEAVAAALRLLAAQVKAHPARLGALCHDASSSGGGGSSMGAAPQLVGGLQPPPLMLAGGGATELAFAHPALGGGGGYMPGGAANPSAAAGLMAAFCGTAVEVTFRLLTPVTRTGNIIGKGGEHIKRVRSETGARIKVFDPAPGSEERVVALTSSEDALSPYCAAQDALIRCVIALTADESPNSAHRVRLLTAQASVGIVLGKRGATVSQLRQETGASIKVLPAEPVPAVYGGSAGGDEDADLGSISSAGGVSSGFSGMSLGGSAGTTITTGGGSSGGGAEEVIQVEGTVQQCVAALRGVATLLRGWQIRRLMAAMQQQQQSFGAMQLQHAALAAAAAGGLPVSPTGVASLSGPMSPPSPGVLLPSTLISPVQPAFMAPPGSGMGHMALPPAQRPPCSYMYHLSNAQVGAVLGKGGAHIAQIRQMSGARMQLHAETEGGGRVLVVSGLPEQCHAAHSMTNAFLSMGRCEPCFPAEGPMMA